MDDVLAADHPVLRSPSGALLFPSEADARNAARELEEPLTPKVPHIADLDAVLTWVDVRRRAGLSRAASPLDGYRACTGGGHAARGH